MLAKVSHLSLGVEKNGYISEDSQRIYIVMYVQWYIVQCTIEKREKRKRCA